MTDYAEILKKYVDDINSGKITAGIYTKKAIKRFQEDLKRQKDEDFNFVYLQEEADRILSFAESLKPGDLNGKTIHLLPWQIFVLSNLEGWRYKDDKKRKRFRMAYIELNRKNGKTTGILEPMILYNFIKYQASESYIVSSRDDLAEKTFKEIKDIILADKTLEELLDCKSLAITFKDITEKSRLAFFCDGGKDADGFKPRFFCLDEYHAFASDKMLVSMQYGMRSKRDAQGVMITTADVNIDSPCYAQNVKARNILDNILTNDEFFTVIYALDEKDDYHNPEVWQKANPSLYDIIDPSVIQSDIDDAELTPHKIPELKAKTFGIWGGGGEQSWMPVETFIQHEDDKAAVEDFEGEPCWCGLDLSQIDDLSVFTKKFRRNGLDYYYHRIYVPEMTAQTRYRKENINFYEWIEKGIVTAIPGPTIDYDFIARDILEDAARFKIMGIGYDRWQSNVILQKLEEVRPDLLLIEIEQSLKKLSPIFQSYEKSIRDGKLVDNNPVSLWCALNTQVKPDINNNYKPMKKNHSSQQKIDVIVSSTMAHGVSLNEACNRIKKPLSFEDLKALL